MHVHAHRPEPRLPRGGDRSVAPERSWPGSGAVGMRARWVAGSGAALRSVWRLLTGQRAPRTCRGEFCHRARRWGGGLSCAALAGEVPAGVRRGGDMRFKTPAPITVDRRVLDR